ncbi:MAG: uncharacterized protein A8A55_1540 [Amphiamblys sp. WSBS2006]|nr:MAG: uncharacterized protein A8A55_1540 [Amphiamblys sp. WSBS2006]
MAEIISSVSALESLLAELFYSMEQIEGAFVAAYTGEREYTTDLCDGDGALGKTATSICCTLDRILGQVYERRAKGEREKTK